VHRVGPPFVPSSHRSRSRCGSQERQTGCNEGACGNATMDGAARHLGHVDKPYPRRLSPGPASERDSTPIGLHSTAIGWDRARPPGFAFARTFAIAFAHSRPPTAVPVPAHGGACPAARKRPPATPVEPALSHVEGGRWRRGNRRLPSWQWGSGSWQASGRPLASWRGRCRIGTKMFTCGDRCSRQRRARAEGIYCRRKARNCWA
jgi:hypothetical protein